jgi:soluble lytic murein transglycosylase
MIWSMSSKISQTLKVLKTFRVLAIAVCLVACANLPAALPFGPTLTPGPTATLTPLPTSTVTPTLIPAAQIEAADQALFEGDWDRARAEYQSVLAQSSDPRLRAAAQLGIAHAHLNAGDAQTANADFSAFLQAYPASPQTGEANFLLGETDLALGNWNAAIEAYRRYEQQRPTILDSYVEERIGQAAMLSHDYVLAAHAYAAALAAPRAGAATDLRERLAEAYTASGDAENALAQYEVIYQSTDQNWRKARADFLAGRLLYSAERKDEAYQKFLDAVNHYPEARDSFEGLLILVNDEVPVDDLQRGLTNYYAQNYEPALAAFDRYLADHLEAQTTALYFKGLTHAALHQEAQAIQAFRQIVQDYPQDSHWTQAYFQIAFVQSYPDDAQTFQDFVAAAPTAPEAPDALYRAARLCERNDDFRTAAKLWTRIAEEYPASTQATDAAMQADILLYRNGELTTAAQRFEVAATLGSDPAQHARAWLWIGKIKQQLGDEPAARSAWTQAAALDPHGYYSLRADQLLRGEAPFTPPANYDLNFDFAAEKSQAEAWLRATFPQAAQVEALSEVQPGIRQEARFIRGAELWRLGWLREAHAEFDSLRLDLEGDPLAMWQLALYFHEIGAYDLSIRAARKVVDLAGYPDTLLAPPFILHLRYPAPFASLVLPAAAQYTLSPFLLLSKMRIESFFWKYALSSAEARGLNQIIPPTADDIARRLGLTNFDYDDLYRPSVSIPMGAFYLGYVGDQTADDPAATLAGYYAGPSNASLWQTLAHGDPDLFVEVIRLPDAKHYVQTAYEYFEEYRVLYGK